jgi:group I intron endonuclease
MHTIYKVTNIITKNFYVGKTSRCVEARFGQHIQDAFTYRKFKFHKDLVRYGIKNFKIETIDNCITPQYASFLEKKYIKELKPFYNMKSGFKKENTESVMAKVAMKSRGRKPWNFGRTGVYTDEQIKKFSRAKKNKPGHKWSDTQRENQILGIKKYCRKVIEINSGKIFYSVSEVSRSLNISKSAVKMILNGKIKNPRKFKLEYLTTDSAA